MTTVVLVLILLAAGYLALGLYGKYRLLREEFEEARKQALAERNGEEPPP